MAAMNAAILSHFNIMNFLIFNMDATQFTVGADKDYTEIKYITRDSNKSLKAPPKPQGENGLVSFFIKFYLLICAYGLSCDPVFVLQDDNMEVNQIDICRVVGLGMHHATGSVGYLVYSKTRCCNSCFYIWYFTEILIP